MSIVSWLTGGIVKSFTDPLTQAWHDYLAADTADKKLEYEKYIQSLENQRDIAVIEARRKLSATSLGRWLIVVPWGIWWAAIFAVSIINPLFGLHLTIDDVPQRIHEMALVLVPAIVIADAGIFAFTRK